MTSLFVSGPAGVGKTTYALGHARALIQDGVLPESILILVPQRVLGLPYHQAFQQADWPRGSLSDVVTLGGLARRSLELYWPLVAARAGFDDSLHEPTFLTLETSQYFMAHFADQAVREGLFESVSLTPSHIMRQTLDNLSKAAVNGFPLDTLAERLSAGWGSRHSSRLLVFQAAQSLAEQFRRHCLARAQLDFSLQIELFMNVLLHEPVFAREFKRRYRHLVADNLEEQYPVTGDFVRWLWPDLDSALLLYDEDAGYRLFLGADPVGMADLAGLCDEVQRWQQPVELSPVMTALARVLGAAVMPESGPAEVDSAVNPLEGFTYTNKRFFPQMLDWVADRIAELVAEGVDPGQIVVLAPVLNESLRFAISVRLAERGIPSASHRPSRALREEPAVRTMLTLMALAHPQWGYRPPLLDVSNALNHAVADLDPVRSWLLAQIVYGPGRQELGSFDAIRPEMQSRITYRAGTGYEVLRQWLAAYAAEDERIPPDHFFSRLFGEVLSQPGFGFHTDLDAGRLVAQLIESARKFRQTLYPEGSMDWEAVTREYFELVQQGLLAALYVSSWEMDSSDAVLLAPAHTFLMRNRSVDYQFWLDVGSSLWWERLEQPLTHPYVLQRGYPPGRAWTDEDEINARRRSLRNLVLGLVRHTRRHVFAAIANLGEQGYEQRGPLLQVIQQVVQRYGGEAVHEG